MKKIFKGLIVLILLLCSTLISACNDGDKISLFVNESYLKDGNIELVLSGDPQEFLVEIKNYNASVSELLHYDFTKEIAKIDKVTYLGEGKTKVQISAISSGSTTLRISTYEQSKYVEIGIKVTEKVQKIESKNQNPYIIKNDTVGLNFNVDNYIKFTPDTTSQRDVNFYYIDGTSRNKIESNIKFMEGKLTFLSNGETFEEQFAPNTNTFSVVAESASDNNLTQEFTVTLVDKIDKNLISLYKVEESGNLLIESQLPTFIRNEINSYSGDYFASIEKTGVTIEMYTLNNSLFCEARNETIESNTTSLYSNIKALSTQTDSLIVKVYDKNFPAYFVTKSYDTKVIEIPTGILINDVLDGLQLVLYDNQREQFASEINLQIFPEEAYAEDFEVKIEFLENKNDITALPLSQIEESINLKLNGINLLQTEEATTFIKVTKNDIVSPISIWAKNGLINDFYIKFTAISNVQNGEELDEYNQTISYLSVVIRKGVETLTTTEDIPMDSTNAHIIYIEEGDGEVVFDKLTVTPENASIGYMDFKADIDSRAVCVLSQIEDNTGLTSKFKITPYKTGDAIYEIMLENGKSIKFRIKVVKTYNEGDFELYLTNPDKNVAQVTYDSNRNLESIVVRNPNYVNTGYLGQDIKLTYNIEADKSTYNWNDPECAEGIEFDGSNLIVKDIFYETRDVKLSFTYKKVQDFKLTEGDEDVLVEHTFKVSSIFSINEFNISCDKDVLYREQTLGYFPKINGLHQAIFRVNLSPVDYLENEDFNVRDKIVWKFAKSINGNFIDTVENGNILNVQEYGTFDKTTFTFTFNSTQQNITNELYVFAYLEEYDTSFSSRVKVLLDDYVQVSSVLLRNFMEEIYLDPIHNKATLLPSVLPENANDKSYSVTYISDNGKTSPITISHSNDTSKIYLTYNGNEGDTGIIRIVPISNYTSESDYQYSFTIPVKIADGTEEYPLYLSTKEDLININTEEGLSKHYVISGEIDLTNQILTPFGALTGTIKGKDKHSCIKGIKLQNFVANKSGLFTEIAESGKISNLKISGEFAFSNMIKDANIGLLCGVNYGVIDNVNVTLTNNSRNQLSVEISKEDSNLYGIGLVCGINNKYIKLTSNNLDSTLIAFMNDNSGLNIRTNNDSREKIFLGGIAGINAENGEISAEAVSYIYNMYGYNTYINFNTTLTSGAIVGYNNGGKIENILGGGEIVANESSNDKMYIGGLVGKMTSGYLNDNTSRVYVRSKQLVAGLVGYLTGGEVENNTVEGIYNSSRLGAEYALIIYTMDSATLDTTKYKEVANVSNGYTLSSTNTAVSYNNSFYNIIVRNQTLEILTENSIKFASYVEVQNDYDLADENIDYGHTYYYKAEKESETIEYDGRIETKNNQKELNDSFNIIDLPFDFKDIAKVNNIKIESSNNEIVSVLNNGKLLINNVGVANIKITSLLNSNIFVTYKLFVSNKIDYFDVFISSSLLEKDKLSENSKIIVYKNKPVNLYTSLYAKDVLINNSSVKLVEPTNTNFKIIITSNIDDIQIIELGQNNFIVKGTGESVIGDLTFATKYTRFGEIFDITDDIKINKDIEINNFNLKVEYRKGASEIKIDKQEINSYPSSEFSLNVVMTTDDTEDKFVVEIYDDNDVLVHSSSRDTNQVFKVTNLGTDTNANFVFELLPDFKSANGKYTIKFIANNGLALTREINILPQPITSIAANIYANYNAEGDILQATTVTDIIPGQKNYYLNMYIDPVYAQYDYIEIVNSVENYTTNSHALFTYLTNNSNYSILDNGIRIYKGNIVNHLLSFSISSSALPSSTTKFEILAYKNGQVVYNTTRQLRVKLSEEVIVSIASRPRQEINYVVRGVSYLLEVKSGKYNLDQIVLRLSDTSKGLIRKENGQYYLDVYSSCVGGTELNITSYGEVMVNRDKVKGGESQFNMIVMDFILKDNKVQNEFDYFELPLGTTTNVLQEMVKGLQIEYSASIRQIQKEVDDFINEIKDKGELRYGIKNDETGAYDYVLLDKTKAYETEYFNMTFNNELGDWLLIPKKVTITDKVVFDLSFNVTYSPTIRVIEEGEIKGQIIKNLHINSKSSIDSPLPISNVQEFMEMKEGRHYILLNDIVLPAGFKPIETQIASLDGNNKEISVISFGLTEQTTDGGEISTNSITSVGIFKNIGSSTLIKNVTIVVNNASTISIAKYTSTNTYIGLLVGTNSGVITNCKVYSKNKAKLHIAVSEYENNGNQYVGGLVGNNTGYITNSKVELFIDANTNLAGFVANNSGHISACYVKNSNIENVSSSVNETNKTAGLVIENSGNIFASYIQGQFINDGVIFHSNSTNCRVIGRKEASSFVFTNRGNIQDCFADIPVIAQSNTSGFVIENLTKIERCYSTSKLKDNSQASYTFYISNTGEFINCFVAKDINSRVVENNRVSNVDLVKELSNSEFADESKFKEYIIADKEEIYKRDYVWFYAKENEIAFSQLEQKNFETLDKRPILVASNVDTISDRELLQVLHDEQTGEEIYVYQTRENAPSVGSVFNPIIISNASELENNIINTNITNNQGRDYNFNNYRIVKDIDYTALNQPVVSKLFKTNLVSEIEGNFLSINNYSINTNEIISETGLFATLGSSLGNNRALIKNLTFTPKYINVPNAKIIGAVAGTSHNASLIDVKVTGNISISSKNIAGGIIGLGLNSLNMINCYSNISAVASNLTSDFGNSIIFSNSDERIKQISYSGSIAGVISGENVEVLNAKLGNKLYNIAKISGLAFGGICNGALVDNLNIVVNKNDNVKAYAYGGIIAGHNSGRIENCVITQEEARQDFYVLSALVPRAVGGVAGLMTDGIIKNCTTSFDVNSTKAQTVGGVVGLMTNGELFDINSSANVIGCSAVGGFIGRVSDLDFIIKDIIQEKLPLDESSSVTLTNCNFTRKINVKLDNAQTWFNNELIFAYAGGKIGIIYKDADSFIYTDNNDLYESEDVSLSGKMYTNNLSMNIYASYNVGASNLNCYSLVGDIINLSQIDTLNLSGEDNLIIKNYRSNYTLL